MASHVTGTKRPSNFAEGALPPLALPRPNPGRSKWPKALRKLANECDDAYYTFRNDPCPANKEKLEKLKTAFRTSVIEKISHREAQRLNLFSHCVHGFSDEDEFPVRPHGPRFPPRALLTHPFIIARALRLNEQEEERKKAEAKAAAEKAAALADTERRLRLRREIVEYLCSNPGSTIKKMVAHFKGTLKTLEAKAFFMDVVKKVAKLVPVPNGDKLVVLRGD